MSKPWPTGWDLFWLAALGWGMFIWQPDQWWSLLAVLVGLFGAFGWVIWLGWWLNGADRQR